MKRFGCFSLLVLLLCGGWFFYRVAFPPRIGGTPFSQLPPQTQQQRRAAAQQLVQQIEAIARPKRSVANRDDAKAKAQTEAQNPEPFVITASEDQLNTLLQDRLRTEKFPVSDLSIGLSQDILSLQGNAKYKGVTWPVTISGALTAQNGALQYNIQSLSVTGLPAPGKLRDQAQKAIENGLKKAFANPNRARIESVEITPGKLVLRGQTG